MHPNPAFRRVNQRATLEFLQGYGFGTLMVNGADGPLLAHVPFWINAGASRLETHLARSNPILRAIRDGGQNAVFSVIGPHSYISPDWYEIPDQVPTWNYVAAHLRGQLQAEPAEALPPHLERLSARFEDQLDGVNWTQDKVSPEALARMYRQIVLLAMVVEKIDATWKLGQNKPEPARRAAADAMAGRGIGDGLAELADLMRNPPMDVVQTDD